MMRKTATVVVALLLAPAAQAADDAIRFTNVSKPAGLYSLHRTKHPDRKVATSQPNFVDVYRKGYHWNVTDVTFVDADGDGTLDVFAMNAPHCLWSRLWLGDGKGNFAEVDPQRLSGATLNANSRYWPRHWRVLAYDLLANGAQDIFITSNTTGYAQVEKGGRMLRCFTVRPKRPEDFVTYDLRSETCGTTLLLSDLDGDGVLDFISGACPRNRRGYDNRVMFGIVIDGAIEQDRTEVPVPVGNHAIAADFDGDGLTDILGRGGQRTVRLLRNLGRRRFTDVTEKTGLATMPPNGPVAAADFNNDGRPDLYCHGAGTSSVRGGVKLYLNRGDGSFTDVTAGSGLISKGQKPAMPTAGTATTADFDSDGRVDLFVCVGSKNLLWRNLGDGKFVDVTAASGVLADAADESSNAAADFDGDGRVDLLTVTRQHGVGLLRNTSGVQNAWLRVKPVGPRGNPEAAGARVTVYEPGRLGDRNAIIGCREVVVATEFKVPRTLHFGLGKRGACDLRVVFPGGKQVEKRGLNVRQTVVVTEGSGKKAEEHVDGR